MSGIELHSLRDVWRHNLEKFPGKTAFIDEGASYSYAECDLLVDRLRRALAERFGFAKGDTLAIAGPNCFPYVIGYWAAMKSGGVAAPVNIRLGRDEIAHILSSSDARILLVHRASWPAIQPALALCPGIRHVIGLGMDESFAIRYEDLVAQGDAWDDDPEIGEDDLGIVMHTSGTTGRPKGAMMRQGDLLFNNRLAIYAHGLRHEDIHLLVLPMFHATALYSLVPTSALLGSTIVLAPRPEAHAVAELIRDNGVTTFFGVPTLFDFLVRMPDLSEYHLDRTLRLIAYAGARMPVEVIRGLHRAFPLAMLHNFFGLTETISMTHVLPSAEAELRPESIGKLLPHVRQRIVDEQGRDVPIGAVGEMCFHRDNVICGYWKEPERLAESMDGEWFKTGDLAAVDEEGYVYLKGRSKDMIIVGGENVYALEVERCILGIPGVADVAVIGIPATGIRSHLGELVKAIVVAQPDAALRDADIKRHCMERLASFKVPQVVEFRGELPRNAAGKVLRRLLK